MNSQLLGSFSNVHENPSSICLRRMLQRRDNIDDFLDGLIETEIFPYPDGQREIVPATYIPIQRVIWKPGALETLTQLTIVDVKYKIDGVEKHVHVTITLTPEEGVGTYELEYEIVGDSIPRGESLMGQRDLERVRMAMWARYEWVKEKVEWINYLRWEVSLEDNESGREALNVDADLDENLSEELDPYDDTESHHDSSITGEDHDWCHGIFDDSSIFPDAEKLKQLDMDLLRQLFERKELLSLYNTINIQHESLKLPEGTIIEEGAHDCITDSPKRKRQAENENMDEARKRLRSDLTQSVREGFMNVAKALPDVDSTDEQIRALRAAAGGLHMAARLLELDVDLQHSNMPGVPRIEEAASGEDISSSSTSESEFALFEDGL